ncbi:hypothetical protein HYC85_009905 [Camellia sinensis]|uniref:ABC transporter family G domain-containing protein n=1 Tax=Camellia sinensis TaxID=4442 RepID=A0A7J7HI95_CAMSI|nr:hypothetical protein HYC85_009905 [Camellia sinensis]
MHFCILLWGHCPEPTKGRCPLDPRELTGQLDPRHNQRSGNLEKLMLRSSLFDENDGSKVDAQGKWVVDVTKLDAVERNMFIDMHIKHIENDNLRLLHKQRKRIDKTAVIQDLAKLPGMKSREANITIVDDISGIIKPRRCTREIFRACVREKRDREERREENGKREEAREKEEEGKKTVMAVIADIMIEASKRKKQAGIVPDPDIDAYMKRLETTFSWDSGLHICADTLSGDAMRRGISSGQKKRLTTGEMIVGPTKALFMDEISNGLYSSITYQIVACLQQLAHIADATVLVALLQPAPESFDLFDDIILMTEGKIVYHGPVVIF